MHGLSYKLLPITLLLVLFGCKKKDTHLGTDVQPESDALNAIWTDTARVFTHTVRYDSARSYTDRFKYLGSNQDLIFGRTDASIYTNFSIPDNVSNVSFGEDAVLDSCVMMLTFTQSFVGDTTTTLTYNVHQLTQPLVKGARYFMNSSNPNDTTSIAYNSTPLCSVKARVSASQGFYTIKLPLDHGFASSVITNAQFLVNNATFQSAYKGFYITTKTSNNLNPSTPGALMKIDLDNPVSGVYVYYHNGPVSAAKEAKVYRFAFSGNDAMRFNNVNYSPFTTGAHYLLTKQLSGDSAAGSQNIFLKGIGGTKAIIRIPSLNNFTAGGKVAVSRAELILRLDPTYVTSNGTYDPPPQLSLVAIDSIHHESYVIDQYFTADLVHFGGNYDPDVKQYVFNIARHVQAIMSGTLKNYGFYLVVANPDPTQVARRDVRAERVVLGGALNPVYPPRFNLTYVKLPYDK